MHFENELHAGNIFNCLIASVSTNLVEGTSLTLYASRHSAHITLRGNFSNFLNSEEIVLVSDIKVE